MLTETLKDKTLPTQPKWTINTVKWTTEVFVRWVGESYGSLSWQHKVFIPITQLREVSIHKREGPSFSFMASSLQKGKKKTGKCPIKHRFLSTCLTGCIHQPQSSDRCSDAFRLYSADIKCVFLLRIPEAEQTKQYQQKQWEESSHTNEEECVQLCKESFAV